jgi:hypothetical protein
LSAKALAENKFGSAPFPREENGTGHAGIGGSDCHFGGTARNLQQDLPTQRHF